MQSDENGGKITIRIENKSKNTITPFMFGQAGAHQAFCVWSRHLDWTSGGAQVNLFFVGLQLFDLLFRLAPHYMHLHHTSSTSVSRCPPKD